MYVGYIDTFNKVFGKYSNLSCSPLDDAIDHILLLNQSIERHR